MTGYYFIYTGLLAWTVYSIAKAAAKKGNGEKLFESNSSKFDLVTKSMPKMAADGLVNKLAGPDWHQFWMAAVVIFNTVLYMYVIPILRVRMSIYLAVAVTLGFWFFSMAFAFILHKKAVSFKAGR